MSSLLKDARCAANQGLEFASETAAEALDGAKKGVETVKGAAESSASSVFETALKGFTAVAGIATMLRRLDLDDGLSWFGLARRRSPFLTIAAFGTGILVGTGIGCLIAPMSGAEARRSLRERFDDYMKGGMRVVRSGEQRLEQLEHQAEEIASKAASGVKKAASEVKEAASEVKDDIAAKASEVKDDITAKASEVKKAAQPASDRPNGRTTPNAMRS